MKKFLVAYETLSDRNRLHYIDVIAPSKRQAMINAINMPGVGRILGCEDEDLL